MISERELEKIKRESKGLRYCSLEVPVLNELIEFWEKYHPVGGQKIPPLPPPPPPDDDPGFLH